MEGHGRTNGGVEAKWSRGGVVADLSHFNEVQYPDQSIAVLQH